MRVLTRGCGRAGAACGRGSPSPGTATPPRRTVLYCTVQHCTVLCRSRHPSETDCLDKWLTTAPEIAAGDLRDTLDDGTTNPVWTMRGYTQVQQLSWQIELQTILPEDFPITEKAPTRAFSWLLCC